MTTTLKPDQEMVIEIINRYKSATGETDWSRAFEENPEWLVSLGGGKTGRKKASNIKQFLLREGLLSKPDSKLPKPKPGKKRGRPPGKNGSRLPTLESLRAALEANKVRREAALTLPARTEFVNDAAPFKFCPCCGEDLSRFLAVNQTAFNQIKGQ